MAEIKTDRDFVVHKQPNGDLWVQRRGGKPYFVQTKTAAGNPTSAKKPTFKPFK